MLNKVYEEYLGHRNEALSDIPTTLQFKNQTYKVLDYLGGGIEGAVVRVEDASGKRSIMKIFLTNYRHILRQQWDYYKMNKRAKVPYTVMAVDYKNSIFQFTDMRGIPLRKITARLTEAGATEDLITKIQIKMSVEEIRTYEQNTLYDIDRHEFVSIDPH